MNPDRIDTLADLAAAKVRDLILEARDSINEAINAALEEAQESEDGKATLRLAPSITWDLDGSAVSVKLSVTTRRKFEAVASLDDPNQKNLPLTLVHEEDYTEAELRDRDGDAMPEAEAKAARMIAKALREAEAKVTVYNPGVKP